MKILLVGAGLQGMSFAESLYKNHSVSSIGYLVQTRKCSFYDKVYPTSFSNGDDLIKLLNDEHFDVVVPIIDGNVPYISKNKDEIEAKSNAKCAVPSYDRVYQVEDKSRFMDFCQKNDIPHPKTTTVDINSINSAVSKVGFPAIVKPDYSVGARGITKVNSIEELSTKLPDIISKFGSCTLQEFIDNEDYYYNVMLYRNKEGKFLAHTIIKIVRMYPIHAGSSSCCVSVENDELLNICKDCLDKLDWVGMADFDVLQRLDNKEYKIIEINPRVPASLRGASISGINFPVIIVNDALGLPIPEYKYSSGKTLRFMGIDLLWFIKSNKRFKTKPSWFRFFGKNIYYMDIYKNDPSSWWTWIATGLQKLSLLQTKIR